jgi:NitT/TauT family transport system substrate-binding protein
VTPTHAEPRARRRGLVMVVLLVVGLAGAGCGGESGTSANEATSLTVGAVPISTIAPIRIGIDKGFFADAGLDVEIRDAQGGAELVPQVLSGDVEIAFANTASVFTAAVEGLPVEIVAPATGRGLEKEGRGENLEGALMVAEDSPVRSYRDLAGKTVAVNALGGLQEVLTAAALRRQGVDPGDVEYLEIPFPDMLAALDAGRADAALLATPFKAMAEQSGRYRPVGFPAYEVRPELIYLGYFVAEGWAEDNEEVLEAFLSALRRSMLYASDHEPESRQVGAELSGVPADVADALPPLNFRPDCEEFETSSAVLAELMVEHGVLEREPDLDELIRPGFCAG